MDSLKKILEPEELRILEVKYQSKRFGEMAWPDVDTWAKALLIKINTITGWVVPDETLEVLVDQFRKKLIESYGYCNPDEIEYAFRNYGSYVKDWGKQMNLSLIHEVMVIYLNARRSVSDKELRVAEAKEAEKSEPSEKNLSEEMRQSWFDEVKSDILSKKRTVDFIPVELCDWLISSGRIKLTQEQSELNIGRAIRYRKKELLKDEKNNPKDLTTKKKLGDFLAMIERGYLVGSEILIVKNLSKRISMYDYITTEYVDRSMSEVQTELRNGEGSAGVDDGVPGSDSGEVHYAGSVQNDGGDEKAGGNGEPTG